MVLTIGCGVFLAGCLVSDLRTRKIKRKYSLIGTAIALILQLLFGKGIVFGLLGLVCGFVVGFLLYACGTVGAGDSKAMLAIGSFLGWKGFLNMILLSILAGGVLGLLFILSRRDGKQRIRRLWEYLKSLVYTKQFHRYEPENRMEFPFALPMMIGFLLSLSVHLF